MMQRLCVGMITGAHGLRGLLRIKSFTGQPEDIGRYGRLSDATGEHHWRITVKGQDKDMVLAQLEGIDQRQKAKALAGTRLFVERTALPPPEDPDSYYHADLIGLQVKQRDGRLIGVVKAVHNFGAGDILDITANEGHSLDLPFTRQAVPVIDISAGFMVVTPPAGLWDHRNDKSTLEQN